MNMMIIKRDKYLRELQNRMHNGLVKVITGVRRSGKSYLLFTIFKDYLKSIDVKDDQIIEIELDKRENREYRDPDVILEYIDARLKGSKEYYILLDEVQMLEDFEGVLNSLLRRSNVDIYVTGSNSKFLSKDIITEFRGRGDEVHIFPLSFQEFMQVYENDIYHGWTDYITYGGLPLVATMKTEQQKIRYLTNLFSETYLKDIIERNHIEKTQELEDLINILASSIGSLTNPTKIQATYQSVLHSSLSNNTIKQYIEYLEEAFIISSAYRYDVKGRKYIGTPLKYYFEDIGLRNARLGFRQNEETHLMENIIYNELLVRGYNVDVGVVDQYYTDEDNKRKQKKLEVDFVCNQGSNRLYIQSALSIPDKNKMEQEQASLIRIKDSFRKIIIVKDGVSHFNEEGIYIMNLFDFLLNKNEAGI